MLLLLDQEHVSRIISQGSLHQGGKGLGQLASPASQRINRRRWNEVEKGRIRNLLNFKRLFCWSDSICTLYFLLCFYLT